VLTEDDRGWRVAYGGAEPTRFGWHALGHTFCSHLAMKGAPARAIQELAGHASLVTTERYMHLSPAISRQAIGLLESRGKNVAKDPEATEEARNCS
jgi:integrase